MAGFVILVAVMINLLEASDYKKSYPVGAVEDDYMTYTLLFLLCSLFDVVSHALKESIVRTQPLNQENFTFKISVAQLFVGLLITPFILAIS